MRRTAAVLGLTFIGMWLIVSFKSSPVSRITSAGQATAPSTTVPAGPTAGTAAAGSPPPGSTTQPAGSGPRTIDGDVFSNRYGDVQVAVVLNGTQIIDVKPLKMPFHKSRSQDISDQAAPLLHDEVIQAQSAQIDTIGGATYTTDSYARSLQSALDKAHA